MTVDRSQRPLLRADGLARSYTVTSGWFGRRRIEAVRPTSFTICEDEVVALVGESGSGKTTLARMTVGLIKPTSGSLLYRDISWRQPTRAQQKMLHKECAIVFQNPYQSLNPRMRIGTALAESVKHAGAVPSDRISREVDRVLEAVHLPIAYRKKYPRTLSGGERQRVALARALSQRPKYLVADEPTSALDVSISAEILNLLMELRDENHFSCLFVTHDLGLALAIADRVLIMRDGEIVDSCTVDEVRERPLTSYAGELLDAAGLFVDPAAPGVFTQSQVQATNNFE